MVLSVTTHHDKGFLKFGLQENDIFRPLSNYTFSNAQSLPKVVRPNGAFYIFNSDWFVQNKGFIGGKFGLLEMSQADSIDVDTLEDFQKCESLFQQE